MKNVNNFGTDIFTSSKYTQNLVHTELASGSSDHCLLVHAPEKIGECPLYEVWNPGHDCV